MDSPKLTMVKDNVLKLMRGGDYWRMAELKEKFSHELDVNPTTVYRAVKELHEQGRLVRCAGDDANERSNYYGLPELYLPFSPEPLRRRKYIGDYTGKPQVKWLRVGEWDGVVPAVEPWATTLSILDNWSSLSNLGLYDGEKELRPDHTRKLVAAGSRKSDDHLDDVDLDDDND